MTLRSPGFDTVPITGPRSRAVGASQCSGKRAFASGSGCEVRRMWSGRFGTVIGSHGGSYAVYRALAVSAGALDPIRRPDLTNTHPAATIGPFPQWTEPEKIAPLDPWGHLVSDVYKPETAEALDIRPTIAITRARLDLIEMRDA